jgi:hypothetical protein
VRSQKMLRSTPMRQLKWLQNADRLRPIVAAACLLLGSPVAVLADQASEVAALEAQCEEAREAKIKPLRDAEIARCKEDTHNAPGYCERYWSGYGNAVRGANGATIPRMFDDLPICVAAFEARKALKRDGS